MSEHQDIKGGNHSDLDLPEDVFNDLSTDKKLTVMYRNLVTTRLEISEKISSKPCSALEEKISTNTNEINSLKKSKSLNKLYALIGGFFGGMAGGEGMKHLP